ncbi:hypothetical protein H1R20_g15595, partial [Candolleomyces eurysporus]
MIAIRLLPFATAVFLSVLHTELVTARPLHREVCFQCLKSSLDIANHSVQGLNLRSLSSQAYGDGALALREPFDQDDTQDLVRRIILSEAEIRLNFPPPPPPVPGNPATNKPLPPRPVTPPPPVPGKPANNKPLPAKPKGKRSFVEDEFKRRAILDEIVEELLRRDYFVDMDLD